MSNELVKDQKLNQILWGINGIMLSFLQPLLGLPISVYVIICSIKYEEKVRVSAVRLFNFFVGITGIILSIRGVIKIIKIILEIASWDI